MDGSTADPTTFGGKKSIAHILGQFRLERIFKPCFDTKQEEKVYGKETNQDYWVDVMLFCKGNDEPIIALEVDTYQYGSQKKKSPDHMKKRDRDIMKSADIPIVRIDIDALKEGKRKTKFYQTDEEIEAYVLMKRAYFFEDKELYMNTWQRG